MYIDQPESKATVTVRCRLIVRSQRVAFNVWRVMLDVIIDCIEWDVFHAEVHREHYCSCKTELGMVSESEKSKSHMWLSCRRRSTPVYSTACSV